MAANWELGKLGEEIAVKYLTVKGYTILERNYRYLKAEIDIIALKDGILAIVEVKSRSGAFYESISDTISTKKRKLLVMAADHYVHENALDAEVRFDVFTVLRETGRFTTEHFPDAFYHF